MAIKPIAPRATEKAYALTTQKISNATTKALNY